MSKQRKILSVLFVLVLGTIGFLYGTTDVARKSIQFDLRKIGESIYEAHSKTGKWPAKIADLEGTEYLNMPYRRDALEKGLFVIIWQQDLKSDPKQNRDRIVAYDNGSLFARLGWIWACSGDLTVGRVSSAKLASELASRPQ